MTVFIIHGHGHTLFKNLCHPRFSIIVLVDEKYIMAKADNGTEKDAISCGETAGIEQTSCYFLMGVFTS
jgi:hypothetical protein